jgi:hypothetical protein
VHGWSPPLFFAASDHFIQFSPNVTGLTTPTTRNNETFKDRIQRSKLARFNAILPVANIGAAIES